MNNDKKSGDKNKTGDASRTKEHNSKETFKQEGQAQQGPSFKKDPAHPAAKPAAKPAPQQK